MRSPRRTIFRYTSCTSRRQQSPRDNGGQIFIGSAVSNLVKLTTKLHAGASTPSSAQGVHTIVLVCAQSRPIKPRRPGGCRLDAGPSTSHCNARRCKVGHLANDGSKRPKSPPASRQSRTSCHHAPNLASNSAPKPILTETSPDSDWVEGLQAWVRANERPFCRCSGQCPYCSGRGRSLGKQEQTTPCVPEGLPSSGRVIAQSGSLAAPRASRATHRR